MSARLPLSQRLYAVIGGDLSSKACILTRRLSLIATVTLAAAVSSPLLHKQ